MELKLSLRISILHGVKGRIFFQSIIKCLFFSECEVLLGFLKRGNDGQEWERNRVPDCGICCFNLHYHDVRCGSGSFQSCNFPVDYLCFPLSESFEKLGHEMSYDSKWARKVSTGLFAHILLHDYGLCDWCEKWASLPVSYHMITVYVTGVAHILAIVFMDKHPNPAKYMGFMWLVWQIYFKLLFLWIHCTQTQLSTLAIWRERPRKERSGDNSGMDLSSSELSSAISANPRIKLFLKTANLT